MQLSLLETDFWIGGALRAAGMPYGALGPAIRMVQWTEAYQGEGCSALLTRCRGPLDCDAASIELVADDADSTTIKGYGQSALLIGPGALDLAMAKAESRQSGLARLQETADLQWLPALADTAAERGFTAIITYQADEGGAVLALPGNADDGMWWMQMACATPLHDRLMSGVALPGFAEMGRSLATRGDGQSRGAALLCLKLSSAEQNQLRQMPLMLGQAAGARIMTPDAYAARWREVLKQGFQVEDAVWRDLSALALTTVIEGSESSRLQAGADG